MCWPFSVDRHISWRHFWQSVHFPGCVQEGKPAERLELSMGEQGWIPTEAGHQVAQIGSHCQIGDGSWRWLLSGMLTSQWRRPAPRTSTTTASLDQSSLQSPRSARSSWRRLSGKRISLALFFAWHICCCCCCGAVVVSLVDQQGRVGGAHQASGCS